MSTAYLGDTYVASIAKRSLVHLGRSEEDWDRLDVEHQRAMIAGVRAALRAMVDGGWTFQPPEERRIVTVS